MSVSYQHQSVSLRPVAADASIVAGPAADDVRRRLLDAVIAAGRRGAEPAVLRRAVITGWHWLASSSVIERRALQDDVREAIAGGQTTARAWLPIATAESDPGLLRAAVAGYVGVAPRSVEAREQALTDVIEWFRRDLTLDRVAVFEALLGMREPDLNARLASLRGRLTDVECERVRRHFAAATDATTLDFLAEWGGDGSVARQAQPD